MKTNLLLAAVALSSVVVQSPAQKGTQTPKSLLVLTDKLPVSSRRFSEAMYL